VIGLIVLSPILALVVLLVRCKLGSPVFFRQQRPGFKSLPFILVKFRSMTDARDTDGNLLPDAERLTCFGRFLRKTSLDELPELWNVVRGEMSFVGPRPLLMDYLPRYTPEQARRHDVRPGITGWAQINGRQDIMFSKRLELDVWYVDHCSLPLDLKILLMTPMKVFAWTGVRPGQDVAEVDDLGLNSPGPVAGKTGQKKEST
jgi:sugar transferase EpsL